MNDILQRINAKNEKSSQFFTSKMSTSITNFSETEHRNNNIKMEANRLTERRLNEIRIKMENAEIRLKHQKELLNKKLLMSHMEKQVYEKSRQENIERQKKKHQYEKTQLINLKKAQNEKDKRSQMMKDSLLMQNEYLKVANQLRKYYSKKEFDSNHASVGRLEKINSAYKPAEELQITLNANPDEVKKKIAHIMTDPLYNQSVIVNNDTDSSRFNTTMHKNHKSEIN